MKILIVEDEFDILQSMEEFLLSEHFVVETATNYNTALEKISIYTYDCILLDISLPGGTGLMLLQELKRDNIKSNVIIVSAKDSIDDKIDGLNLGADDYLTKPFHLSELLARIKAVLRRKKLDGDNIIHLKNVSIDFDKHMVKINNKEITLNRKEFDILCFFATNTNRVITKEALAEHAWGDNIDSADSFDFIYSQVKNLRKKLTQHQAEIDISNVYGVGYKMNI